MVVGPSSLPPVLVAGTGGVAGAVHRWLHELGLEGAEAPGPARVAWADGAGGTVPLDLRPAGAAWAASGAMALTGEPDGSPELVAADLVDRVRAAGALLALVTARLGRRVDVDALGLLAERAAIARFGRRGPVSVGGSAHLLPAADGWLCLNLGRPDDLALLPAWLEVDLDVTDWRAVTAAVRSRPAAALGHQAGLLGLPVGVLPGPGEPADDQLRARGQDRAPAPFLRTTGEPVRRQRRPPLVVDLSSLWAGPLCARLLRDAGARVVKVEGRGRLDGARRGPADFYDLLHAGTESVVVDPGDPADRSLLADLVAAADVVIEGSRPRVAAAWGLDPAAVAARGGVWVAVTGYGRTGPWSNRVAFGDDAAVAGGLVQPGEPPRFVADAVADPLTGLVAALAATTVLAGGGGAVLDVALREVARWMRGDGAPAAGVVADGGDRVAGEGWSEPVRPPAAARPAGRAPGPGAHDASLRAEVGRGGDLAPLA